jgi:hypothetical protein
MGITKNILSVKDGENEYLFRSQEFSAGDWMYLLTRKDLNLSFLTTGAKKEDAYNNQDLLMLMMCFLEHRYVLNKDSIPFEDIPFRILMGDEKINELLMGMLNGGFAGIAPEKKKV